MSRRAKIVGLYTIRNETGQFLGSYRAFSETDAIQKLYRDQNIYSSTFRKSAISIDITKLTASIED